MTRSALAITRTALDSLAQLDKPLRRRVQTAVDKLGAEPRPEESTPLAVQPATRRLRVGDVTVVYELGTGDQVLVLLVEPGSPFPAAVVDGDGAPPGP
ncbi:type II toxin-antitoxin system RelE family toxin [Amycolatopsis sp. NPDC004378]